MNSRGFKYSHCYRHLSIRTCNKDLKLPACTLELFPHTTGRLSLPVESPYSLNLGEGDFGRYTFQFVKDGNVGKAKILEIESVPFKEMMDGEIPVGLAKEVDCPKSQN